MIEQPGPPRAAPHGASRSVGSQRLRYACATPAIDAEAATASALPDGFIAATIRSRSDGVAARAHRPAARTRRLARR